MQKDKNKIDYVLRSNNYGKEHASFAPSHRHAFFEICMPLNGTATHKVGDEDIILSEGNILFMPSETVHTISCYNDSYRHIDLYMNNIFAEEVCAYYSNSFYDNLLKNKRPIKIDISLGVKDFIKERARFMISLCDVGQKKEADRIYRTLCSLITGLAYDKYISDIETLPDWYTKIIKNIYKPEIILGKVETIANITGFSYSHLSKLFKKQTGETLANFFLKAKINYGARLLSDTNLPVAEIAKRSGYDSLSHFTKIFKKYNGTTPAKYRQEMQKQ